MNSKSYLKVFVLLIALMSSSLNCFASESFSVKGVVRVTEGEVVSYANVALKGTSYGCVTDEEGKYHISAPAGKYTMSVTMLGYSSVEKKIDLNKDNLLDVKLTDSGIMLDEVIVASSAVSKVRQSAYNAIGVDAKELKNTTKNLGDALAKAPGVKLRESGGVGSDMQLMLDGFSGKHVKVFIDGVPQEGVGNSFGLNNIPINFADRIEIYKGVVPVGFGTDALG